MTYRSHAINTCCIPAIRQRFAGIILYSGTDILQWHFQCLLEVLNAAHQIHYKHWQRDSTVIEVYNRSAHAPPMFLRSSRFIRITLEPTGLDLREWYEYIKFLSTATDDEPSRSAAILQDLRLPTKRWHNSLYHSMPP